MGALDDRKAEEWRRKNGEVGECRIGLLGTESVVRLEELEELEAVELVLAEWICGRGPGRV